MLPALFQNYSTSMYWRVDLTLSVAQQGTIGNALASLYLKKNEPPTGGSCFSNIYSGSSMSTQFQIECANWIDSDGQINTYEFYYGNQSLHLNINRILAFKSVYFK